MDDDPTAANGLAYRQPVRLPMISSRLPFARAALHANKDLLAGYAFASPKSALLHSNRNPTGLERQGAKTPSSAKAVAEPGYHSLQQAIFDASQAVPAPDFKSGGAGFQTPGNTCSRNDRALALVGAP
jgi:hypothetical protein